jgi:hypothetical protein
LNFFKRNGRYNIEPFFLSFLASGSQQQFNTEKDLLQVENYLEGLFFFLSRKKKLL